MTNLFIMNMTNLFTTKLDKVSSKVLDLIMASYKEGYSKKPLWQWILIYLIIGGVVYALIYYFIIAKRGGYVAPINNTPASSSVPTASTAPTYRIPGY